MAGDETLLKILFVLSPKRPFKPPLMKSSKPSEPILLNGEIIHLIQKIDDIERYEASGGNPAKGWREKIEKQIETERARIRKSLPTQKVKS